MTSYVNTETQTKPTNTLCGICYTDLDGTNTVITSCDHAFCSTCFFKWLGRKETCALCRKILLTNTVVEERLNEIQVVQEDLVGNYRYMRVLKKKIKSKKRKLQYLSNRTNALMERQIRMRTLLDETRNACRRTIQENEIIETTIKMQTDSLELLKTYRKEWEELHTPLVEEAGEEKEDEEEEEDDDNFDTIEMGVTLNNMLEAENRSIRETRRQSVLSSIRALGAAQGTNEEEPTAEEETAEELTAEETTEEDNEDSEDVRTDDLTVVGHAIEPRRFVRLPGSTRSPHIETPFRFRAGEEERSMVSERWPTTFPIHSFSEDESPLNTALFDFMSPNLSEDRDLSSNPPLSIPTPIEMTREV